MAGTGHIGRIGLLVATVLIGGVLYSTLRLRSSGVVMRGGREAHLRARAEEVRLAISMPPGSSMENSLAGSRQAHTSATGGTTDEEREQAIDGGENSTQNKENDMRFGAQRRRPPVLSHEHTLGGVKTKRRYFPQSCVLRNCSRRL